MLRRWLARVEDSRYGAIGLLVLGWAISVALVNPIGEFPLNDDWAWSLSVRGVLEGHGLRVNSWAAMSLIAQIGWGTAVCSVFGFSFTALRLATALFGLAAVIGTYVAARQAGAGKRTSLIAAVAVATNPLVLQCSNTFMTDVPFLAFMVWALIGFQACLDDRSRLAGVATVALTVLATLTRQLGLVIPLVMIGAALLRRTLNRRAVVLIVCSGVLALLSLRGYEHWLRTTHQLADSYGHQATDVADALRSPLKTIARWPEIALGLSSIVTYLGLFLLPFCLWIIPDRLQARRSFLYLSGFVALVFGALTVAMFLRTHHLMPFDPGDNLVDLGLGPVTLRDTYILRLPRSPHGTPGFWWLLTWLGVLGGTGLVFLFVLSALERIFEPSGGSQEWGIVFVTGYLAILLLSKHYFDRYFIPLIPIFIIAVLPRSETLSRSAMRIAFRLTGVAAWAVVAAFAVAATHDYLAWNRARWAALHDLATRDHAAPEQIDGGFEFNGLFRYGAPERPGKSWWWVEDDKYLIALGPVDGYHTMREYPYSRWLDMKRGAVLALER